MISSKNIDYVDVSELNFLGHMITNISFKILLQVVRYPLFC